MNRMHSLYAVLCCALPLTGCVTESFVSKQSADENGNKPSRHLSLPHSRQLLPPPEIIPPAQESRFLSIPKNPLVTITADSVEIRKLLNQLALDVGLELDIYAGVQGVVSINAIQQPLVQVLQRLSEQTGLLFDIRPDYLVVRADHPFWFTYPIDYLNVQRSVESQVMLNMAVSSGPGSDNDSVTSSQTGVTTLSQSDFWQSLTSNLRRIVFMETDRSKVVGKDLSESTSQPPAEPDKQVVVNREAGVVSIYASNRTHKQISDFLSHVMPRAKQEVLIEATIVEIELADRFKAGVDWRTLVQSQQWSLSQQTIGNQLADMDGRFHLGVANGSLALELQLIKNFGETRVLSSPKIMAINNQTALLKVVDNHVYFSLEIDRETRDNGDETISYSSELHTVPVGLIMNVTPFVSGSDEVTLSIRPTISRIIGFVEDPAVKLAAAGISGSGDIRSAVPVIREREMEAVLKVRSGQIAVMGGLMQDLVEQERNGVPGLEQLPLIGDAFAYQGTQDKKSELIIFIRPSIIQRPDVLKGDLQRFKSYLPISGIQGAI